MLGNVKCSIGQTLLSPYSLHFQSLHHFTDGDNLSQITAPLNGTEVQKTGQWVHRSVYSAPVGLLQLEASSAILHTITWGKLCIFKAPHRKADPFRVVPEGHCESLSDIKTSFTPIIPYWILNKESPFCPEVWSVLHLPHTP